VMVGYSADVSEKLPLFVTEKFKSLLF
jgi:hypothetical protein